MKEEYGALFLLVTRRHLSLFFYTLTEANKKKIQKINREKILIITSISSKYPPWGAFHKRIFVKPSGLSLLKINGEGKRD